MVRLKDIAARAGVCVMTVSKALRGAADIAAPTSARLRLLAQQMGYVPDFLAQGLRNRTTQFLGLVLSSRGQSHSRPHRRRHRGRARHELGYDLILTHDPEYRRARRGLRPPPPFPARGRPLHFSRLPAGSHRRHL